MFDKDKYWKNREKGKRGQGEKPAPTITPNLDTASEVGFSADGKLVVKTRAWKRRHVKLRSKHTRIPLKKLAAHRKKLAYNKRKEARELKKEKVS